MPSIVGGLDIHRKQLTFDYLDMVTGEVKCGQIAPADREHLRRWLGRFENVDGVAFAAEACTGWRYVTEELQRAGAEAAWAEPGHRGGPRAQEAGQDRADARLLRELLADGRVPECWIPPTQVLEHRVLLELYHDLRREHTVWGPARLRDVVSPGRAGLPRPRGGRRDAAAHLPGPRAPVAGRAGADRGLPADAGGPGGRAGRDAPPPGGRCPARARREGAGRVARKPENMEKRIGCGHGPEQVRLASLASRAASWRPTRRCRRVRWPGRRTRPKPGRPGTGRRRMTSAATNGE